MNKTASLSYVSLAITTCLVSCYQQPIEFPDPASQVVGTYTADTYVSPTGEGAFYPIQGKTMTLKLSHVSRDSVRIELEAAPNGEYSPGGNRTIEQVLVQEEIEETLVNKQQVNCMAYRMNVGLAGLGSTTGEYLRLRCGTGGAIDYYFTTPGKHIPVTVRFVKI